MSIRIVHRPARTTPALQALPEVFLESPPTLAEGADGAGAAAPRPFAFLPVISPPGPWARTAPVHASAGPFCGMRPSPDEPRARPYLTCEKCLLRPVACRDAHAGSLRFQAYTHERTRRSPAHPLAWPLRIHLPAHPAEGSMVRHESSQ